MLATIKDLKESGAITQEIYTGAMIRALSSGSASGGGLAAALAK
jgi:hypothetical protein